jgi:hypothetical protein
MILSRFRQVWLLTEYGLVNGFIDHLYTPLGTTSNYSCRWSPHSQIITAPARSSPACYVFNSRSLATASNSGDSSRAQILSSQSSLQNSTLNWQLPGWRPVHTILLVFSSQADIQLTTLRQLTGSESESESYITTDGQSASLSWSKALVWSLRPDLYYFQTFAGLLRWGALSDDRTGLPFTIAAGPGQRSHFRVRVPWDSLPYFTVYSTIRKLTSLQALEMIVITLTELVFILFHRLMVKVWIETGTFICRVDKINIHSSRIHHDCLK